MTSLGEWPPGEGNTPVGNDIHVPGDSNVAGGGNDSAGDTPTTPGTADSCSAPMHGSRYVLCGEGSRGATQSAGGVWVKGVVGSNLEEIKGAKYSVRGWSLHANQ